MWFSKGNNSLVIKLCEGLKSLKKTQRDIYFNFSARNTIQKSNR